MCAISGKVSFGGAPISQQDLERMLDIMTKRGPNDSGTFRSLNNKVALGSNRLAIIDLSTRGHQPMTYKNGRYVIVSNGEIYNFREERQKLQKIGYRFKSECDTEVIPALFDKYGDSFLKHLRGMFAFCIYDNEEQILFLARDRIGKKPLHYYYDSKCFIFASEIKAILSQKEVSITPNQLAIAKYLNYGYIPSPLTGFNGILKLPPGHFLKLDLKTKKIFVKRYWEPLFNNKLSLSENEWCKVILDKLFESTKLRMTSDVPVGAFLSGGVDSSAVVATMSMLSKTPINTFTVAFSDNKWNEAKYAKTVSDRYKTNHHEIIVSPQNISEIEEVSANFEEPFADAGVILSYQVSKLAKKHVTVVLNGDGGDELFAGYPNRHLRLKRDVDYLDYINFVRPAALLGLKALKNIHSSQKVRQVESFLNKSKLPLYERFASYNQVFPVEEIMNLVKSYPKNNIDILQSEVEECFSLFKGNDMKDAGLKFDLLYWLPDDLLAKADKSSMYSSIEARSPLLDHEMIELAGQIPFNLKAKNRESKYIFKKALEKIVPKENLYRQKMGFGMPLHKIFTGKLLQYSKSKLLTKKARVNNYLNGDYINMIFKENKVEKDNGPKIWSLLTLELFLNNYF